MVTIDVSKTQIYLAGIKKKNISWDQIASQFIKKLNGHERSLKAAIGNK